MEAKFRWMTYRKGEQLMKLWDIRHDKNPMLYSGTWINSNICMVYVTLIMIIWTDACSKIDAHGIVIINEKITMFC